MKNFLFAAKQEQNTAVDGWNEQISQLTAECDQLKDSLQEVTKVSIYISVVPHVTLQTSNLQKAVQSYSTTVTLLFRLE